MPNVPTRHADHDPLLVAAYAAGDATGTELDAAQALVAGCPDCAALHHDLRSIAAALPTLPVPVRRRDFRLAPEQAAALRPPGWRRLLDVFAGPRFRFAGPLGTGLATLGLAGLLVAGGAGVPLGGGTTSSVAGAPSDGASAVDRELASAAPSDAVSGGGPKILAPVTGGGVNPDAAASSSPGHAFGVAQPSPAAAEPSPDAAEGLTEAQGISPSGVRGEVAAAATAPLPGAPLVSAAGLALTVVGLLLVALRLLARRAS